MPRQCELLGWIRKGLAFKHKKDPVFPPGLWEISMADQMIPAFLRVTKAPFLLMVLSARQLSLMRTNFASSGTQMRLF
jgi:hypothetical protein